MSVGKDEVLEVLSDWTIRNIRFSVGPISVNAQEYAKVADNIESEAIIVKPGSGNVALYYPQINTLKTRDGDPKNDINVRSNLLHECTHMITDLNKWKVSTLTDEVAAYLAQMTYMRLIDENVQASSVREPVANMFRLGLQLVTNYKLDKPAGFGAIITTTDIAALFRLIDAIPGYDDEPLIADGVGITEAQMIIHAGNEQARLSAKLNYDAWLIGLAAKARSGSLRDKQSAYGELRSHFFMVYQPIATELLQRLSSRVAGDTLSEWFYTAFSQVEMNGLISNLKVPKPLG